MKSFIDYYDVLGITQESIKKKLKRLIENLLRKITLIQEVYMKTSSKLSRLMRH